MSKIDAPSYTKFVKADGGNVIRLFFDYENTEYGDKSLYGEDEAISNRIRENIISDRRKGMFFL